MKLKLVLLLFLNSCLLLGQSEQQLSIQFLPSFEGNVIDLEEVPFEKADLKIETLQLYISEVTLSRDGTTVFSEANSFHLLDAEKPNSLKLQLTIPMKMKFDQLRFNLGIDSLTNCSGVYGGDLDPTKGMYWTWQSGYINFKLEGTAKACPARKNQFQFHIGGYQYPFNSLQAIVIDIAKTNEIVIPIKIDEFIKAIDLTTTYQVMSPSALAVDLAKSLRQIFTFTK